MRLPLSKIWRAFPELDRFSDRDCARFVASAKESHGCALGCLVILLFLCVGRPLLEGGTSLARGLGFSRWPNFPPLITIVLAIALLCTPLILGLMARDFVLRRQLRKMIRKNVCLRCNYSLLGLPVPKDLHVTCPECGERSPVDASLAYLTPLPDIRMYTTAPGHCLECRYALAGLISTDGEHVPCPECGHVNGVAEVRVELDRDAEGRLVVRAITT